MRKLIWLLREWGLILCIAVIIIVATSIRPAFLSLDNIMNILRAYSTIGIASVGMTLVIICGGMDLSVGSTVSLSAVITMLLINATVSGNHSPAFAALLVVAAGLLTGSLVGLVNGGIIAAVNGRMGESFIITYAMQIVVAAAAQAVVKGMFQAASYSSGLFKQLGIGIVPVVFFLSVAAVMQFVLRKTMFGRHMYFLGANMEAARMAGIKIRNVRILAHILCGACAGLAGVLIVSRVNSASTLQGVGYELDAMASVAVGGTSLAGGTGSVLKTVLGVLVIGVLLTALNILGIKSDAQLIVRGSVIVLAVMLDAWNKRAAVKRVA
ncbi:MAG: ABC transporter permease [Treponema sp.]|jgi:ribose/xylose/arabinose/galactoside ABC-type transport system permease subunit|nr:ABC transporter permease [Treponema sp.]